ncbi:MAG TPA: RNase H-like domain-containing protein, partial [Thermoplasmataceae archaeon]|nr:RNase H-like domain-containing protein [Thermoplasmataceae archaeon]
MSFHFDEHQNIIVDGYKRADHGEFSPDEMAEAYVLAGQSRLREENPGAAEKLEQYLNHQVDGKLKRVFSAWREGLQFDLGKEAKTPSLASDPVYNVNLGEMTEGSTDGPNDAKFHSKNSKCSDHNHPGDTPVKASESSSDESYESQTGGRKIYQSPSIRSLKISERLRKRQEKLKNIKHEQPGPKPLKRIPVSQRKYELFRVFGARKYKCVADKVRPVKASLPEEFRIRREITGNPLEGMPELPTHPPDFQPVGRYTQERKEMIDLNHDEGFLWKEEMKLLHHLMSVQEQGFAWEPSETGTFREDFFPPVKFPTLPHEPWVEKNIPIPPGIFADVCKILKDKIDAGIYEPSSSSYRSKWFCVVKKDGKSLRIVHSLEPLNAVTIQYSGVPPATADLARSFAGRACGGTLDLYVGYDERPLDLESRDLTTFQTPFGPYRLVKLPMGWTNSVPIFHDDVTHIMKEEIPEVTIPYLDDVPVRGPATRYELPEGGYETIPENPGIRRFVWEHLNNMNRVIQRMKYCGGTFSGPKAYICCSETLVVGHRCTYEGRMPEEKIAEVVLTWPDCKDKSDVRAFLGTASQLRMFIQNFSKKAAPLTKLTADIPFEWGEAQRKAMEEIKEGIRRAPALQPINYDWDVHLAVDTSYKAVGWYIHQANPDDPKQKFYNYFGSLTLNEREARFSQSKRELYGLKLALEASYYYVYGCWKLTVETDASYIKGMLDNPSCGPNATINRWIEDIRKYHFSLVHIKGILHGPDGLSRRPPGGWQPARPPINPEDYNDEDTGEPIEFSIAEGAEGEPFDFEDFKNDIDPRSGYFSEIACSPEDIQDDLQAFLDEERQFEFKKMCLMEERGFTVSVFQQDLMIPTADEQWNTENPYSVKHRSVEANHLDQVLPKYQEYLKHPDGDTTEGMDRKEKQKFQSSAEKFMVDVSGRLYKKRPEMPDRPQLVVERDKRMYVLHCAHDSLGHKGTFATMDFIQNRFWWPGLEQDVVWYVSSCIPCQNRQLRLIKAPPMITYTPSLFQKVHVDTMIILPKSNGCKYIVHGRDSLSCWSEARAMRQENARTLGEWFFDDIICRWGCPEEVVTDNASQMRKMLDWLTDKYEIRGIRISPYNSQANGKIERAHFDLRQALVKATGGDLPKWFFFLKHVLWADRVTTRRGLGCSPYFIVTGAEPLLPFDIVESTWLVSP